MSPRRKSKVSLISPAEPPLRKAKQPFPKCERLCILCRKQIHRRKPFLTKPKHRLPQPFAPMHGRGKLPWQVCRQVSHPFAHQEER